MKSRRNLIVGVAIAVVLAALLAGGHWLLSHGEPEERVAEVPQGPPQLYCIFIRPMTSQPRVEFLFDIRPTGNALRFEQLLLVDIDGQTKTEKTGPFPAWRFDAGTDPARLDSEITVFDNSAAGSHAENITIEIYKYRPETSNREWIEAGLRSIYFQNIHGRCQQTRPVKLASTSK